MDASLYILELLSSPELRDFLAENVPDDIEKREVDLIMKELIKLQIYMNSRKFRMLPPDQKQDLIKNVRQTSHSVGNSMSMIVGRKAGSSNHTEGRWKEVWKETKDLIIGMLESSRVMKGPDVIPEFIQEDIESSNFTRIQVTMANLVLLFNTAFPAHKNIPDFDFKIKTELGNLPWLIVAACDAQPQAIVLIGGLLSFKLTTYDTWDRVKDDLVQIKESNKGVTRSTFYMHIIKYCFDDLPYFLKLCFLYFACYPIGYEIPVTSLTNLWIAEGFVAPGQGEWIAKEFVTSEKEETANKYLEQLIQRSLVYVSKRSFSDTIKSLRLPPLIHIFVIQQSKKDEFLVVNPDQEKIESLFRLAIHHDNKKQYTEAKNNHIHSFIAFNFDGNILGSALLLRVLELRKSTIPVNVLPNMISLQYLGLRGCNISELPKNIGDMKYLLTLDVRDTNIEIVPESLWSIKTLRHVFVKPSPQIKGPHSATHIDNLHTLKTVVAHESWVENIPHFLIHLRKLAISNGDILDTKSFYNLLSHMDKLISLAIMSNIIPSESIDLRAYPNLETVKSIKLDGQWFCRKLFIDNVKFPPNLTKLTLINSGLKEDPMPTLEKLQVLKFLSLQDGAYIGNKMVCFEGGFPQLQFLKLKKLVNLENWEVKEGAMPKLTTLRVVQCGKLNHPSNLRVTITDIDD